MFAFLLLGAIILILPTSSIWMWIPYSLLALVCFLGGFVDPIVVWIVDRRRRNAPVDREDEVDHDS